MKDAVDRVIVERQALEHGFGNSLWLSLWIHLGVVGGGLAAPYVLPRSPPIQVQDGFAVTLPRGGGGVPDAPAPKPKTEPEPRKEPDPVADPPPKPKFKPPPRKTPPKREGLPAPDARKSRRKPKATPVPGGASSATPGLELAPVGPGVPGGTDEHGDWYWAGVQRKIWMNWRQQIQTGQARPVSVQFTILRDGSVTGIRVVRRSGAALLDLAAQRAVLAAAPFAPLPARYEIGPIQVNFKRSQ